MKRWLLVGGGLGVGLIVLIIIVIVDGKRQGNG